MAKMSSTGRPPFERHIPRSNAPLSPRGGSSGRSSRQAHRQTSAYSSDAQPAAHRAFLSAPVMAHCSEKFTYLRTLY
ncbi:hypothetical protein TNCV_574831 [Trichonephila clavipes]|nr:hypothetical protein TNCV_574831 [Trichonephila clavipes]